MKKYKTLTEFLGDLEPTKRTQVESIRDIIQNLGVELTESIKWNAPNYNYKGIDRITFNLMNKEGKVKIIIHMGASVKEQKNAKPVLNNSPEFVTWNSDIRGTITFSDLEDIAVKRDALEKLLIDWLNLAPFNPKG